MGMDGIFGAEIFLIFDDTMCTHSKHKEMSSYNDSSDIATKAILTHTHVNMADRAIIHTVI